MMHDAALPDHTCVRNVVDKVGRLHPHYKRQVQVRSDRHGRPQARRVCGISGLWDNVSLLPGLVALRRVIEL